MKCEQSTQPANYMFNFYLSDHLLLPGTRLLTQVPVYNKTTVSFNCNFFFFFLRMQFLGHRQSQQSLDKLIGSTLGQDRNLCKSLYTTYVFLFPTPSESVSSACTNSRLPGLGTPLSFLRKKAKIVSANFQLHDTLA